MSWTPALREKVQGERAVNEFLAELIDTFFRDFPEVDGIIVRIGESDGLDVKDDFHSDLHLKNPAMVSRFLRRLLPVFEDHGRACVFRQIDHRAGGGDPLEEFVGWVREARWPELEQWMKQLNALIRRHVATETLRPA